MSGAEDVVVGDEAAPALVLPVAVGFVVAQGRHPRELLDVHVDGVVPDSASLGRASAFLQGRWKYWNKNMRQTKGI